MSRRIEDLHPELQVLCKRLLESCVEAGHPVIVVQTYRSFEEQEALYAQGRWRPGSVVTWAKAGYSWHNFRRAFDVAFSVGVKISWEGPWREVGAIGRGLGLVWGGDWPTKPDRPHFEWHPSLTLEQARDQSMILETVQRG